MPCESPCPLEQMQQSLIQQANARSQYIHEVLDDWVREDHPDEELIKKAFIEEIKSSNPGINIALEGRREREACQGNRRSIEIGGPLGIRIVKVCGSEARINRLS